MSAPAPPDNEIKGRLALITGASGGLGRACARELYAAGAHLALTYSSSQKNVNDLIKSLSPDPTRRVTSHQVNMAVETDIHRLFDHIKAEHKQAGPDILISNAGYAKRIPELADITLGEWDHTMYVNLRASFLLTKLSVPHMQSHGWGRIVYMGSISAYGGGINGCHYAASKAGLMGMAKNLAIKLAADGITVNDVAPAMIGDTGLVPNEEAVRQTPGDVKNIPVGRLGTPQEVGGVVRMLCQTGYLTGQSILLSGGLK